MVPEVSGRIRKRKVIEIGKDTKPSLSANDLMLIHRNPMESTQKSIKASELVQYGLQVQV